MSETFPAASLDLLPKLIEILLTEHSTSPWYLTLQNSFEGLDWIMKETRASGVHYLPHFIRRFYKVCCLPFQIHDRNKYKAWRERASQSCLLPSPLPPSPFLPVSHLFHLSYMELSLCPRHLFFPLRGLFIPRSSCFFFFSIFFSWEDISNTSGFWRRPLWSHSEIFIFAFFSVFFSNWQRLEGLNGCIRKTHVKCQ